MKVKFFLLGGSLLDLFLHHLLVFGGNSNSNTNVDAFATVPFSSRSSRTRLSLIRSKSGDDSFYRTGGGSRRSRGEILLHVASKDEVTATTTNNNNDNNSDEESDSTMMTDDDLLETVPVSQFQELCRQLHLPTKGTKQEMLLRLRKHAEEQAHLEEIRQRDLKVRVEEGVNADERERHEILGSREAYSPPWDKNIGDDEDEEEAEGFFYFELPTDPNNNKKKKNQQQQQPKAEEEEHGASAAPAPPKRLPYITQSDVLAPPPPPPSEATLDEDGNRVVTVYSTTDHNDLTGVAAAQPGQAAQSGTDPMVAGSSSVGQPPQPWDNMMTETTATNQKSTTSGELEAAQEKVAELVQTLLAMSGAPAFQHLDTLEELDDLLEEDNHGGIEVGGDGYTSSAVMAGTAPINGNIYSHNNGHTATTTASVGFDPSQVPTHLLVEASKALRANRGQVLQEVLRKFEIHAVGQDGMAGDNLEDGGGHFKEVSKVRAFLEGYRRAEVRKASRTTVTFLLDKLVSEGVQGLDLSLATMSRSNDDSTSVEDDTFELNDSLFSYLNDIIREQENKVQQLGSRSNNNKEGDEPLLRENTTNTISEAEEDPIEKLWNQTKGEDGETIESIDPSDPKVNRILQQEMAKEDKTTAAKAMMGGRQHTIPETAPEKLLLLLTLLRERIKTEAAFGGDERSRNLRLLAYCLQCTKDDDREELIKNDLGSSIDKLDTFLELVASSIEYAESTSHQLQPAKRMPLNVALLKSIFDLTETIREQSAWKASGLGP